LLVVRDDMEKRAYTGRGIVAGEFAAQERKACASSERETMDNALLDGWLRDYDVRMIDEASASSARTRAREVANSQGLSRENGERLATIASELAYNQLIHARSGRIAVRAVSRGAHRGVEIVAADAGAGIADPTVALAGEPRTTGSLGAGLAGVRRLATEVDFDVRLGEGTCVWARLFAEDVPRRRQVGLFGRPFHGEPRSGDHGGFRRSESTLALVVSDGLGHGDSAREASLAALHAFGRLRSFSPKDVLEACHEALTPTRGAVVAAATLDETSGALEVASVGNVGVETVAPRRRRRFGGVSAVLGSPQGVGRIRPEDVRIDAADAIVMFTDGIKSSMAVEEDLSLLRDHPIVIAHQIAARFGRENDDVLVLVAR
jgi:anti-sigma regulatory factor (Ser/Thr protein kinase)